MVGFGRVAQAYYVPALRTLKSVVIAAIVDPLPASLDKARKCFSGAAVGSDLGDLDKLSLDALLVASPPSTHLAALDAALRRRLPVFIEKPFLLPAELERLEAYRETARLIMPNFNRRFWPPYQRLRRLCAEQRMGKLLCAEFTLNIDVRPWLSVSSHRLDAGEGGVLCDLGSSQVDLIQYVLGERISRLQVHSHSLRWENDHVSIKANLESGLPVNCELSYAERNRESITIAGDVATARIENPNYAVHLESQHSFTSAVIESTRDAISFGAKALIRHRSMLRYTIQASLAEFFDALCAGRAFSPDFATAAENTRCLEAAARSLEEKTPIEVSTTGSIVHV